MLLVFFAALGALVASFIGVIAERANTGQSFARGRSRCNSCAKELGPLDLVPVLSWVFTLGRCRQCGAKVPFLYPALELTLAVVFAFAYLRLGFSLSLLFFLVALAILEFIVVYDLKHTIVPPSSSLALFLVALSFSIIASPTLGDFGLSLIAGGAIGFAFLLLHALSGGRAMGLGDAPVALSLSLLTAPYALGGLMFSFWIGALCGIIILLARRGGPRMGIEVPFVPFLAIGYILAYFVEWNPLAFII
jgi:leader peptidase (prepilin peptidase)/N-methyltransferase